MELRALDKAHSVDGLVAAHLANHGEQVIDLKAFRYMLRQGRIVLLFDGFDELVARVTYDRAADHLETLLQAAEGAGEDRGEQPHPALQDQLPGADRRWASGSACCRTAGCWPSRTSPPGRSRRSCATATTATSGPPAERMDLLAAA